MVIYLTLTELSAASLVRTLPFPAIYLTLTELPRPFRQNSRISGYLPDTDRAFRDPLVRTLTFPAIYLTLTELFGTPSSELSHF